jgi:hypothetical protein
MILEVIIFLVAAIGALFISGFAVHMFVGGLVSPEVEHQLIAVTCIFIGCVIGFMVWDVSQKRSGKRK